MGPIEHASRLGGIEIAAPFNGHPKWDCPPIGVVIARFRNQTVPQDLDRTKTLLTDFLHAIWPVGQYANVHASLSAIFSVDLNQVLDRIIYILCNRIGFEFATISLVDEDRSEIRTVKASDNVERAWLEAAHHPLSSLSGSPDIQADILRTGKSEIISGWDDRFDKAIFDTFDHGNVVRAFVPIGGRNGIGTIEVGFRGENAQGMMDPLLVQLVKRIASDAHTAIQNAQLHSRTQQLNRLSQMVARLNSVSVGKSERAMLQEIAAAARRSFSYPDRIRDTVALVYPVMKPQGPQSTRASFGEPVVAGTIKGRSPLRSPNVRPGILHTIAASGPYIQADALQDPQTSPQNEPKKIGDAFMQRQGFVSFAGFPLEAGGNVYGILCLNFRYRRPFSSAETLVLGLFAQLSALVLVQPRERIWQERSSLARNLHDIVGGNLRAIRTFVKEANESLILAESDSTTYHADRIVYALNYIDQIVADMRTGVNLILYRHDEKVGESSESIWLSLCKDYLRNTVEAIDIDSVDWRIKFPEPFPKVPPRTEIALFSAINESIDNAVRHGGARRINVSLRETKSALKLSITDNGCGFNVREIRQSAMGLQTMEDRVTDIGGTMKIHSTLGKGSSVIISVPFHRSRDEPANEKGRKRVREPTSEASG
jgi:signal transduction histidine kinase